MIELLPARWAIARLAAPARGATTDGAEPVPRTRTLWWAGSTVGIGLLLSAWWLVPFGLEHAYTTSMGYTNVERFGPATSARPTPGRSSWPGSAPSRRCCVRSRFGITVTVLGVASALATALDPQGSLYNVRLLPLWFISVYLMAAWAFGTGCIRSAQRWRQGRARQWEEQAQAALWAAGPSARMGIGGAEPRRRDAGAARPPRRLPSPRWAPAAVSGAVLGLLAVMVGRRPALRRPAVVARCTSGRTRSRTGPT